MSLRLRCHECRTVFVASTEQVGESVDCPKCGASQVVPPPKAPLHGTGPVPDEPVAAESRLGARLKAPEPAEPAGSVFVPKPPKAPATKSRRGLWASLLVLAAVGVGVAVAWPAIQRWWDPRPKTMVLAAAYDYLHALSGEHPEDAAKFGVVVEPPSIRSFRGLERDKARDSKSNGSFAPLAALHKRIEKRFTYDQATGRFMPKDPLGPAAETLDALHEAKAKAEKDGTYRKMASGDPDEIFQGAEEFGAVFAKLSEGVLAPKKLIPSYRMLVQEAKPPLPDTEKALALDYAAHRESWDALLGRAFPTLKADGPFVFEKAEVVTQAQERLGSAGAPPTPIRLKLVRFRMDAIDTGWKVVSARRIVPGVPDEPEVEDGPDPQTPPEPSSPSPGELTLPSGLDLPASPGRSPSEAGPPGGSPNQGEGIRP
ncbi:hypothetical protein TA3x_003483 [Tundrisphaera sp. TA3]|uniref:hypothetical protein n=1 Tax=Tundrisphaera sp. TA3 TaxID=3435775 RepID=UPI003EB8F523